MSAPNHSDFYIPRHAPWSIWDRRAGAWWVSAGQHGGSLLRAEGVTRSEAWPKLCEQAQTVGFADGPHELRAGARRDRLAACLALDGAAAGWFVPLLARGVVCGASSTLYEHAEGVLGMLLACFGGGIGFACGVMATARPATSPVGRIGKIRLER